MKDAAAERQWLALCPRGVGSLLAHELASLGAQAVREVPAGVEFSGPRAVLYRASLWSRLASRILMPLAEFEAADADALYRGMRAIDWPALFAPGCSLAVDFNGQSPALRNTRFGAQRSKDGIVDAFREAGGERPRVELRHPDLRVSVHLHRGRVRVALDMSGESLHQRGYRREGGEAPLKENLAAAILLRADWPGMAARGGALIDPMCGSGTLLIEAALMVCDIAPALARSRFAFEHWRGHDHRQWQALKEDALGRARRGRERQSPEIRGYDADPQAVRIAQQNIAEAKLERIVRVTCKPLAEQKKPTHRPLHDGLVVCNPPYGERLGNHAALSHLYARLGEHLHAEFGDWQAAIFTADPQLARATGLRSHRNYPFYNGALKTSLFLFDLKGNELRSSTPRSTSQVDPLLRQDAPAHPDSQRGPDPGQMDEAAQMFANRLRKNLRRLGPWLKRENISCYRLYDADMPEYAVAVDVYEGQAHVAEYAAPASVDPAAAQQRLETVMRALPPVLGVSPAEVVLKRRERQRGQKQYQRQGDRRELLSVREGPARLLLNLHDYLDTGLFLDHRPLRRRLHAEAKGADFLNLFCYTGSATVHAALGGARSTTSVDLSATYLEWLRRNLAHNGLGEARHRTERADVMSWLRTGDSAFDLILLDPPSFSNSKRVDGSFDVQRDHVALVEACMRRLRPGGTLYFSNNRRRFRLDPAIAQRFVCEDISAETLDPDFSRNPQIHCCFRLRHTETAA